MFYYINNNFTLSYDTNDNFTISYYIKVNVIISCEMNNIFTIAYNIKDNLTKFDDIKDIITSWNLAIFYFTVSYNINKLIWLISVLNCYIPFSCGIKYFVQNKYLLFVWLVICLFSVKHPWLWKKVLHK